MRDTSLTTTPPPSRKTRKKPQTPPRLFDDPWRDWQPQWQGRAPHALQEKHAPTEPVRLRGQTRDQDSCQRRIVDARLWEALDGAQQDAALAIAFAFEAMSKGLGFATSNWQRVPGARNPMGVANGHARLTGTYVEWTEACHKAGVSHSMVIDILCFGITCRALDRDRRVRAGTSRQNLIEGLALYARLRGWK